MPTTIWLQANQLSLNNSALAHARSVTDVTVLMVESKQRAALYRYHKQKLTLLFSAMRHMAKRLRQEGIAVDYHPLRADGKHKHASFEEALRTHCRKHRPDEIVMMELPDYHHAAAIPGLSKSIGVPIRVLPNTMFLTDRHDFAAENKDKKRLVMEHHYRSIRRRLGVLMKGDEPEGGKWNYDAENRKPFRGEIKIPPPPSFAPDEITDEVMKMVEAIFPDHYGSASRFSLPVTHDDSRKALKHFVQHRLRHFGTYQDAMKAGEPLLFHSLISPMINIGLLEPLEVARSVEDAYRKGNVPLNAAEGFMRQIIGWREYMFGVYWMNMPAFAETNFLGADKNLPQFFWTGNTQMRCLSQCLTQALETGYLHHIQRLMVISNFATLAGLHPKEVLDWFMHLFIDAYDWVMVPNVMGMGMFADGGSISTKPYVSSGAYINKMSDYCNGCAYSVKKKTGEKACPFNYLYWYFLDINKKKLGNNQRMSMMYKLLEKKSPSEMKEIRKSSETFLKALQ